MKAHLISLFLSAVLGASALCRAAEVPTATAYPVNAVILQDERLQIGTTEMTILRLLSVPLRQPAPNVWVYDHFKPTDRMVDTRGCDTLVIVCAGGKIAEMKLVNRAGEQVIASAARRGAAREYRTVARAAD
jgi:hypothetical protein